MSTNVVSPTYANTLELPPEKDFSRTRMDEVLADQQAQLIGVQTNITKLEKTIANLVKTLKVKKADAPKTRRKRVTKGSEDVATAEPAQIDNPDGFILNEINDGF
jgi:hypothetical protein